MNVRQLHMALSELIVQGHGRKPVCIDKDSFRHPLEQDGAVILPVKAIDGPKWVPNSDDDGGPKWNKDGSQSGTMTVILRGEYDDF